MLRDEFAIKRKVTALHTHMQADTKLRILDSLYTSLPRPPFSEEETDTVATRIYDFVWQRSSAGALFTAAA